MSTNLNELRNTNNDQPHLDEIDLFELWNTIWSQKKLILIIAFLSGLLGIAYSMMASPIYQSEATISKPQLYAIKQIDLPSLSSTTDIQITSETIYHQFLENIDDTSVIQKFMESDDFSNYYLNYLQLSPMQAIEQFGKDFTITLPSVNENQIINEHRSVVRFKSNDPVLSQLALEQILLISSDITKKQITRNIRTSLTEEKSALPTKYKLEEKRVSDELLAQIKRLEVKDQVELTRLQQQIDAVREKKLMQTQQQVERLEADLKIAKSLGITTPVSPLDYQRQDANQANVINLLQSAPSKYWLGTETLQQEISNLKNRDNPDAFIDELPVLLEKRKLVKNNPELASLKNRTNNYAFSQELRDIAQNIEKLDTALTQLDKAEFSVFKMVKQPSAPESPIKPNKILIVVLSILLGIMMGLFVALIRSAYKNRVTS